MLQVPLERKGTSTYRRITIYFHFTAHQHMQGDRRVTSRYRLRGKWIVTCFIYCDVVPLERKGTSTYRRITIYFHFTAHQHMQGDRREDSKTHLRAHENRQGIVC